MIEIDPIEFADSCDARDDQVFDSLIELFEKGDPPEFVACVACVSLIDLEAKIVSISEFIDDDENLLCTQDRLARYNAKHVEMRTKLESLLGEGFAEVYATARENKGLPDFAEDGTFS